MRLFTVHAQRRRIFPEYIPEKDFTPHANPDDVGVYLWNEHVLNNYFCRACGIFTYIGDGDGNKDGYRVNLGCVVASRMESAGESGRLNVSAYTYDLIRHQFAGEYRG